MKNTVTSGPITILLVLTFTFGLIQSCKKDEIDEVTDERLFELSQSEDGFVWYKNSDRLLAKSSGSAHIYPFLRTRYNDIAATQLDEQGKVFENAQFPEGSLVVKELYDASPALVRYAILYKSTGSAYADDKGWVWGYINQDGSIADPASKRGISCISCHSQTGAIDYMLMNAFFP